MRIPDRVIEVGAWMLENSHRAVLKATGGRYPRAFGSMKLVELHTVGRKSGRRISTLLSSPLYGEHRIVLVASKGGHQDHPDWYKNLVANPDIDLTFDDDMARMRARTASPEEKAELWPAVIAAYPGYGHYQRNTEREIPVVICEPRQPA